MNEPSEYLNQKFWDIGDLLMQRCKERKLSCSFFFYAQGGDQRAFESTPLRCEGNFPAPQITCTNRAASCPWPRPSAIRHQPIKLRTRRDSVHGARYALDRDPLWRSLGEPAPFDALAWYHCDALGTPLKLTDPNGQLAWSADYQAWGQVGQQRSSWAEQHLLTNPLRFQGQSTTWKPACTTTPAKVFEHPDGHPDLTGPGQPDHHGLPHVHATNNKKEMIIFTYPWKQP